MALARSDDQGRRAVGRIRSDWPPGGHSRWLAHGFAWNLSSLYDRVRSRNCLLPCQPQNAIVNGTSRNLGTDLWRARIPVYEYDRAAALGTAPIAFPLDLVQPMA